MQRQERYFHLRLPPFGNILLAHQKYHLRLNTPVFIYAGNHAKEYATSDIEHGGISLYLPFNQDFSVCQWPVLNRGVVVIDNGKTTKSTLHKFCFHLLNFNPKIVYLNSDEHGNIFFKGENHE